MWRDPDALSREPERSDRGLEDRPRDASGPARVVADREVFERGLDLPRGQARERVHLHARSYDLRGSEVRALSTVGAFRIVPESDLRDGNRPSTDIRHLRDLGLVRTMPYVVGRTRTTLVTLTEQGRDLLEAHRRDSDSVQQQSFHAGFVKPRELSHDAQLYRAYLRAADRLGSRGARIGRVVLDYELKRDYQRFLQANNRHRGDSAGRPDRRTDEVEQWAHDRLLPVNDGHVQFPDVRIEYDDRDGRRGIEDVEVMTPHYRGAMASGKHQAGFSCYRGVGARLGGSRGGGRRGGNPRVAEEVLG